MAPEAFEQRSAPVEGSKALLPLLHERTLSTGELSAL
jgi:hypothetical protein